MSVNKTTNSAISNTVATYYDKKLLMNAKANLVHYQYAQMSVLPKNSGKTIDFRKWTPFSALNKPLEEGVIPDGQSLAMSHITADINQFGGYVAVSDMLDLTALDPVVMDSVELMGDQGGLTIDTIVRDAISCSTNVQYPINKTAACEILPEDKLTVSDIRLAVRTLKKNKAPMFTRGGKGYYVAIVSPETVYDLQSDSAWQDASKYSGSEQIFDGEMGRLYGVVFVETTEAKTLNAPALPKALSVAGYADKVITLNSGLTSDEAEALFNRKLLINGVVYEVANATAHVSAGTITVDYAPETGTPAANDVIYPGEAGKDGGGVSCTMVFGRNAYGVVELEGGNLRSIIKPKGSAGTGDPLDQISTIGWKVEGFAAKVLQPLWIVRIEHGYSA